MTIPLKVLEWPYLNLTYTLPGPYRGFTRAFVVLSRTFSGTYLVPYLDLTRAFPGPFLGPSWALPGPYL